jgi:hypothetical protein
LLRVLREVELLMEIVLVYGISAGELMAKRVLECQLACFVFILIVL